MHGRGHTLFTRSDSRDHLPDRLEHRLEVQRFFEKAVSPVPPCLRLGLRQQPGIGREDEDRDAGGIGIRIELLQQLPARLLPDGDVDDQGVGSQRSIWAKELGAKLVVVTL